MSRSLPAVLILTLAACSSGGPSGSGTTSASGSAGQGSATGAATGAVTTGGSGSGGSSATTGGGGNGGVIDTFNTDFNEAYCHWALGCQELAPYALSLCNGIVLEQLTDLPLAADAGRISFNSANASACLTSLNALQGCNADETLPKTCQEAIVGLVGGTGVCYASSDCQSEDCSGETTSICAAGTCLGVVDLGGACECTNCGACDPSKDLTCFNEICSTPAQVGAACGSSMVNCDTGLDCINGTCVAIPVGPGNPCNRGDGDCQSGSYCFQTGSASVGNCATQVATGQPCGQDADHQENDFSAIDSECVQGDTCLGAGTLMGGGVNGGTCAAYTNIGGSCSPPNSMINSMDSYNMGCFPGLNCVTGTCARPPSSGTCSPLTEKCDPTVSYCASATNTCVPYVQPGGSCDSSDPQPCGLTADCSSMNDICVSRVPSCSPTL
jgi:hypothetical protein